ncbi:pyroglutamyl-peptidase I [Priestia taiwanensis]|uniref:Pyrrolidone-carboxylate peptidase n=1 Tax=Priestia taiwanensis TaxID=1347902 RepID=A0A917AZG9_9BACI|nr:pyroglutamyl-peptidase I [Priestia taiwanensis]MBM7365265.1 pyroglutamyl-peptidase [Priestia taiwanensis]GGE85689.1 pyrrolidone-carboxylate peptidase [Priestia taiwanensis]
MPNVLLTGFDPFGGETINPALEAGKQLDGECIEGYTVISRMVPTVFGESAERLRTYYEEIQPEIVICVGQAGGRADITVERIAINIDDARIPDNKGKQPIDVPIVVDGPAAYFTTLPMKAAVEAMRQEGIPASVSHTAGTFVCNHLFYHLMHVLAQEKGEVRGGFVHIPFLPEQAAKYEGRPSMPLSVIVQALHTIIRTTITTSEDIRVIGGHTH